MSSHAYSIDTVLAEEENEEEAYRLVVRLLTLYPTWAPKRPSLKRFCLGSRFSDIAVAMQDAGEYDLWLRADGMDVLPAESSLLVIKRLFEEGEAYQNLKDQITTFVSRGPSTPLVSDDDHLPVCRILYRLFPSLLFQHRMTIGCECGSENKGDLYSDLTLMFYSLSQSTSKDTVESSKVCD